MWSAEAATQVPSWAKRVIPIAFYALIAVFAYFYLQTLDWATLASVQVNWGWMLAATVASLGVRYWFAGIWLSLLKSLNADLTGAGRELVLVYAKSWLGRYIPGGAAWILGKVYFASQRGISKAKLGIGSFLEGALQIIVVLVSASAMLAFDPRVTVLGNGAIWLLLAAALVGLVLVLPPVFNRLLQLAFRLLRKQSIDPDHLPGAATIWRGVFGFAVSSLLSGLSFFFVAAAVDPTLGWGELWFIIGASNLASALSMVAVFAPAGLGVREGVQLAMLLVVMSPEQALVATVLMRLWSIVMDAAFFGLAWLVRKVG